MAKFHRTVFIIACMHAASSSAEGWLDWVPSRDKLEYCDTKLTDIVGAGAVVTATVAAMGSSVTTVTAVPAVFLIAGESSLMVATGTSISVITSPVVGTGVAVGAVVTSVAYGGAKGLCQLSEFMEHKFITNEPIPLVMQFQPYRWGLSDEDGYASGEYKFVKTDEIIPAGTAVFSLGPVSEDAAAHYPNYNGRGLIKLGQFFDHVYSSDIAEDQRGFAVVPANSLNPILIEKYTHIFSEDTLAEKNGSQVMLTAGTPFQLLKERKDGWAKFELTDGFNLWVEDFGNVKTQKIADFSLSKIDP